MIRVLPVLAIAIALSACASRAPQPAALPAAAFPPPVPVSSAEAATIASTPSAAMWAQTAPRLSARARCFESGGVWRATAVLCEYEAE
jgi:hypothetical protein